MVVFYLVFCLTTAIMSLFRHFIPNLERMAAENVVNEVSKAKFVSYTVYFCLAFIFAPVVIFPVLFEKNNKRFKDAMYESLSDD